MLPDRGVLLFGPLLICLVFLHRIQRVKQVWGAFGDLPAYSRLVSPTTFFSRLLPRIPRISDGVDFSWRKVYERQPLPRVPFSYFAYGFCICLGVFEASKSDIVQLRALFPECKPQLLLADATATKVGPLISRTSSRSTRLFRLFFITVQHFLRWFEI